MFIIMHGCWWSNTWLLWCQHHALDPDQAQTAAELEHTAHSQYLADDSMQADLSWAQVHVPGNSSKDLDDVGEPTYADKCGIDYRLQWVLGVKDDPSSYRGWIQSSIGEYIAYYRWNFVALAVAFTPFLA